MKNQLSVELRKTINEAKSSLLFPPIYEDDYGVEDVHYDEGTFFQTQDEIPLYGRMVFYSGEFYDLTMNGDVDFSMEVFVTDEGNLLKFYTIKESRFCLECQQTHTRLHRMVAMDQVLNDDQLDAILNNLSVDLKNAS